MMKEYKLNKQESLTVMDMVQDVFDRGMVAGDYETEKLEQIIDEHTDEFDQFKKGIEFEVIIRVKSETNEDV
jgi:hypothetical protein